MYPCKHDFKQTFYSFKMWKEGNWTSSILWITMQCSNTVVSPWGAILQIGTRSWRQCMHMEHCMHASNPSGGEAWLVSTFCSRCMPSSSPMYRFTQYCVMTHSVIIQTNVAYEPLAKQGKTTTLTRTLNGMQVKARGKTENGIFEMK